MLLCAAVLCSLQVPLACATYLDDMYVDYNLAQDTLEGVAGVKQWVTNEFKHRWVVMGEGGSWRGVCTSGGRLTHVPLLVCCCCSGIRDDGSRIVDRLLGMVRDVVLLE